MAQDTEIKIGGFWKSIDNCEVKIGSAWKQVETIEVKIGSAWKTVWKNVTYALSGETGLNNTTDPPTAAHVGIRINADGTIDKREGGTYTQIDASTDWIIPNDADKSSVEFKCTNNGDALNASSSGTGTFYSAPLEWWVTEANPEGSASLNLSIEISIDSGVSTHDTGVYSGSANVNPL